MATLDKTKLGICYYHESMGYITRTNAQVSADLTLIQQVTNRVKLYHNPWTNAGGLTAQQTLPVIQNIAQMAKAAGMYVCWVENNDGAQFTAANWSDYSSKVVADAQVAQSVGVDEFLVGNEVSLHNNNDPLFQDAQLPSTIQALCTSVEPVFRGFIGYQDGWWKAGLFNGNLKSIRTLHLTTYRNDQDLTEGFNPLSLDMKEFGTAGFLGEYSTMDTFAKLGVSDQEWADMLAERWQLANDYGISQWLFTFKEDGGYGLVKGAPVDNTPTLAWQRLVQMVS